MQNQSSEISVSCPSFSTYTGDSTADVVVRVSREFEKLDLKTAGDDDGDEFEFVSAGDEVFLGGPAPIGPVFPVFNREIISSDGLGFRGGEEDVSGAPSSSSSEADELDGVPEGTYCVWTPKRATASPGWCKKSKSTGSASSSSTPGSKRWRFRDLLRRSHSDGGKESLVFLTPSLAKKSAIGVEEEEEERNESAAEKSRRSDRTVRITAAAAGKGRKSVAAAHEVFYVRNRALNRTAEKRRSTFLPYKQDLVGFFASVNTMGRTFPPF